MSDIFPHIDPYATGYINADPLHDIYWEQCGNPEGVPVIVLHGGPGGGTTPFHRQFFDPSFFRIILFDQRGCGRSTPSAELADNTTAHLLGDIEALRQHLKIEHWHVFGGSWGATLALHYARTHTSRCLSLTIRSVFLCEAEDIDWFLDGMRNCFPEAHEAFANFIPTGERDDLLKAYYQRLLQKDMEAARQWYLYEARCAALTPHEEHIETPEQLQIAYQLALLEAHYFKHEVIPAQDSFLLHAHKMSHLPCTMVQGRYDMITPLRRTYALHKAWPQSKLVIVEGAGHSALDLPMRDALIQATESLKDLHT